MTKQVLETAFTHLHGDADRPSLADLMRRLGHSSMVAAKRYLHATDSRDRQIADALSRLATEEPEDPNRPRSITLR